MFNHRNLQPAVSELGLTKSIDMRLDVTGNPLETITC